MPNDVVDPTKDPSVFSGFGPESTDWDHIDQDAGARRLLDQSNNTGDAVPPPVGQLAPSTTSPAGEPPNYVAPIDAERKQALEPRAPGPAPGQKIDTGESIVIHHVWETIERAGESAIIHKVIAIGQNAVQLLGKNEQRSKATIQNYGTVTVSLGMDESVAAGSTNSFELDAGASLDIHHRDWMWCVCTTGTGQLQVIETLSEISPTQLGVLKKTGA